MVVSGHGVNLAEVRSLCHHPRKRGIMAPSRIKAFADGIDRLTATVGRAAAWLCLLIVCLQFALVVARYLFGLGSIWLTETVLYAHGALFLLAAAWTLQVGGHVRVDIFYAEMSAAAKARINLLGALR